MNKYQEYLSTRCIECTDAQFSTFEKIYQSTIETNEKFNLTAITEKEAFFDKMIVDSALAIIDLDLTNKKCIDVGTGAGFPGLIISTLCPKSELTLLDSSNKKINYLSDLKDQLGLSYNTVCSRAEDYAKNNREVFDYAFARAVAPLNILLELIVPMLKVGGVFVALKGPASNEELKASVSTMKKLNCHLQNIYVDALLDSKEERSIIYIVKDTNTNPKYPRDYADIKKKAL